jgi:hypothetical protein
MAHVLALEPDLRQATVLKRVIKEHVGAELTVVDSRDGALAAIAERVPDVILLTALLSPRDEEELFSRLRATPGAEHVQTHTIPQLASAATPAEDRGGMGVLGKLRRRKPEPVRIPGCDPELFAEEVITFLQRAAEMKLAGPSRSRGEIKPRSQPIDTPAAAERPRDTSGENIVANGSAWASPFEWRPSSHEGRGSSRTASYFAQPPVTTDVEPPAASWVEPPAASGGEPQPFEDVENKIARAAQREAELAAERVRVEAERTRLDAEREAQRVRLEAERAAEREKERARVEAEREKERLRVEAEREKERLRVQAERQAERLRVEAERQKIEAERKKIEAERQKEAAERERERLRAEAERQRLEAEAAASRRREAERLREEAAKEKERLRKQAEEEKARLRAEAERKRIEAEREAERVRQAAEREAERLRLEAERQKLEAERQKKDAEKQRLEAERQKKDAEKQRLEAERQKAAAERERERLRIEAERQKLEAERVRHEAERLRLEAEREAERLREEAQREAERLRAQAEEEAERARAEDAIAAAKTQEEARQRREAEKTRKRAVERARRHNQAMQDAFAEFRDDPVERPRGAVRLVPLAVWARLDKPVSSAPDTERDELRELLKGLSIPQHVASVSYARGCRIRRVRVPANPQAMKGLKGRGATGPVILSRRALDEARAGDGTT